jgi:hypothetical protein
MTAEQQQFGVGLVMKRAAVVMFLVPKASIEQVAAIVWGYAQTAIAPSELDYTLDVRERTGLIDSCVKAVKQDKGYPYGVLPLVWVLLLKFIVTWLIDYFLTANNFVVANFGEPD